MLILLYLGPPGDGLDSIACSTKKVTRMTHFTTLRVYLFLVGIGAALLAGAPGEAVQHWIAWTGIDRGPELQAVVMKNRIGWLVAAFTFLSASVIGGIFRTAAARLRSRLLSGDVATIVICVASTLAPLVWLQQGTVCRRILVALALIGCSIEFAPEWRELVRRTCRTSYGRVATAVVILSLLPKLVPGAHLYPFTPGISGWTFGVAESDTVVVSGLQLLRDDGEARWYSTDLVLPQPFGFRQVLYHQQDDARLKLLLDYYYQVYARQFPYLQGGRYLHQRYLGSVAFPPHMPGRMQAYYDFPPSRIVGFRSVVEIYSKATGKRTELRVGWEYKLADRSLSRS